MTEPSYSTEVVIPGTGEVVSLDDPDQAAVAYDRLAQLSRQIRDAQSVTRAALIFHGRQHGGLTYRLDAAEVKITQSDTIVWDLAILRELRDEGLPDDRWHELVTETVEAKVSATVAKQIAKANPVYAEIIGRAETRVPKAPTVSVALRAS